MNAAQLRDMARDERECRAAELERAASLDEPEHPPFMAVVDDIRATGFGVDGRALLANLLYEGE